MKSLKVLASLQRAGGLGAASYLAMNMGWEVASCKRGAPGEGGGPGLRPGAGTAARPRGKAFPLPYFMRSYLMRL
ncbi:MAG: hypothetical protein LDL24_10055 [Treponema sp.]|nr:hypothetical protein [Treponema sp.]